MRAFFFILLLTASGLAEWQIAQPGWSYEFPRDHRAHPDFKTEWWYFTGNLRDAQGHEFGFQLTFFRQGVRQEVQVDESKFLVRDFKFAHFAISDLAGRKFFFTQKISRGAFGEAGFGPERLAWIDGWQLLETKEGAFEITASSEGRALHLGLATARPAVIHGENGVSQKAAGAGHASQYYSFTRMATDGELTVPGGSKQVTGETWFDHEWATNQLTPEQAGWNWFSVQFADGTELMLYQMRLRNGGLDPDSSGTFVARDGGSTHLRNEDFKLTPLAWWTSPQTKARYPIRWRLQIASQQMDCEISTPLENQELALSGIAYWEGAIRVSGRRAGAPLAGRGYMELTGYNGALSSLSASP